MLRASPASAPAAWIMGHRFRTGTPALSNFLPSNLPPRIFHLPRGWSRNPSSKDRDVHYYYYYTKQGQKSVGEGGEKFCNRVELITRTELAHRDAAINPFLAPTFRFKRSYENAEPYLTRPLPPPTQGWEALYSPPVRHLEAPIEKQRRRWLHPSICPNTLTHTRTPSGSSWISASSRATRLSSSLVSRHLA